MSEGIKDKISIILYGVRDLEIDGVDSMEKILVQYKLELGTVEETLEKIREILEEIRKHPFRFL